MKGKLHKMESGYILSLNGDIDDPYAIVNKQLAEDYEWYKLSLKNCQAIERGYDLDELAMGYDLYENINFVGQMRAYKAGFQKAIELIGDKKFNENDLLDCWNTATKPSNTYAKWFVSLQQTEWDVEIVEECLDKNCDGINKKGECITTGKPKLDEDGYLILKKL